MFKVGCHLSITGGYLATAKRATAIGANTFQYFSRNPRGGAVRAVDYADIAAYKDYAAEYNMCSPLVHAPYTLNAASQSDDTRDFALRCMRDDVATLENFDGFCYNFHPGSHTGQGLDVGIGHIVKILDSVMTEKLKTVIVLEAMSGKGSEIGGTFGELKAIIDRAKFGEKLGVCIDTCHIYSAGYDIVNDLDGVLEEFDKTVGLNKLKAVHLNDSMTPFASKKDRHAALGDGSIGIDAIARIINHHALRGLPFYLETPLEEEGYKREIALLKSLRSGD